MTGDCTYLGKGLLGGGEDAPRTDENGITVVPGLSQL